MSSDEQPTTYYARAVTANDPQRATVYATLALADAINDLADQTVAELKSLRRELEQIKGAVRTI